MLSSKQIPVQKAKPNPSFYLSPPLQPQFFPSKREKQEACLKKTAGWDLCCRQSRRVRRAVQSSSAGRGSQERSA